MNINKINRKISKIALLMLFIVLSTTFAYKVSAIEVTTNLLETSHDWYCSEHNVPLAGTNPEYTDGAANKGATGPRSNTIGSDPASNIGTNWTTVSEPTYNNLKDKEFRIRENSDFSQVGESYTTPVESWVLWYGTGYGTTSNPSPWQKKWWETPAGKGQVHETTGDRDVNLDYPEDEGYPFNTNIFNEEQRAVAVNGSSLLDNFINASQSINSYTQVAGRVVNFGASGAGNGASASEAEDFADYIEEMTGSRNSVCGKNGFNITRKFDWIKKDKKDDKTGKTIKYSNPTVAKDGNKFIVGPFAIDYVDHGKFSHITDMELVIAKDDGSTQTLVIDKENNKKEFTIKKASNGYFPKPDETFYIVFENIQNATRIKNFKVNFEYMNGTARYSLWDGSITVTDVLVEGNKVPLRDSQGNIRRDSNGNILYKYELKRTETSQTVNAQTVARKEKVKDKEVWYEHVTIERGLNIVESNINLVKKITTEDGKEIDYDSLPKDNESRSFNFELEVKGAITSDNLENKELLIVTAGKGYSTESRVYYWLENENKDNTPTFTLKEIDKQGYTINNIKELKTNGHGTYADGVFTGTLTSDTSLNLEATNTIAPHKGNIKVIKKIDENASEAGKDYINGKSFNIKITIIPAAKGFFKYDGKYYGNKEENKQLEVTLNIVAEKDKENSITLPKEIEWYGDKAPTFTVDEIIPEGEENNIECKSIVPKTGSLVDLSDSENEDKTVKVTVTNTTKEHKASIHIIKTVEITNAYSDELKALLMEKIKDQAFEFDIAVNGYDVEHAVIEHAIQKDNTYIWEYTSNEYTWQGNSNVGPTYSVTEVNAPEGTTMVPNPAEGTLIENVQNDYKVDCNLTNKIDIREHHARIRLNKKVDGTELQDEDYNFDFRLISGIFTYKGNSYEPTEENPVRLTNDGVATEENQYITIHIDKAVPTSEQAENSWVSDEITWYTYGDKLTEKPEYTVNEVLAGEKVKTVDIQPSSGVLDDGTSAEVIINALNNGYETLEGKIHIIKTLEDADKYDDSIINTYKFEFDVFIDRDHDDNWDNAEVSHIVIEPKKIENENKFVWEWENENPITWKENEGAPKYKVVEVNIPEGIEFKEGSNLEGTLVPLIAPGKEETIELEKTEVGVINRIKQNKGRLEIKKEVETDSLNGKEFEFTVTIEGTFTYDGHEYNNDKLTFVQKVNGGNSWTSGVFTWGAISAPRYTVEEKESDEYECTSMINNTGYLVGIPVEEEPEDGPVVTATFTNKGKLTESANLKVTKILQPGQTSDKSFKFDITIAGQTTTVELKAGETYTSDSYTWYVTDPAPAFTVKEYSEDGTKLISINDNAGNTGTVNPDGKGGQISGALISGTSVNVVATNSIDEKDGRFKVKKQIVTDEKYVDGVKDKEFNITAVVTGNFMVGDNKEPVNGSKEFYFTLKADETWESPKITWYGDNAPTVTVSENLSGDDYKGWKNIGISNNGVTLSNGLEIVVTNEYQIITRLDLTVELAGDVWEDVPQKDSKNDPDSVPNGRMDSKETGIDGVEVYIYKAGTNQSELATIYKDGLDALQSQPLITSNNGHWDAFRVNISDENDEFEVVFKYDGQTYESTELLALSDTSLQSLISNASGERKSLYQKYNSITDAEKIGLFRGTISKSARNKYANTSMAKDTNRNEVDSRIREIYGDKVIDPLGNTIGKVNGSTGVNNIYYSSNVTSLGDQTRVESKVKTTDNDGVALDLYKATASTGTLTFPFGTGFEDKFHLSGSDTNITDYGTEIVYHYSATYDYTKHINLGLRKRPEADVEIQKDLVSAKVVVNDRLTDYKFNKLSDLGKDVYDRTYDDNLNLSYTLGLYSTDYYYRAEMYRANMDKNEFDKVEQFYKAVSKGIESTELEVYLEYKIGMRNSSSNKYDVKINSIEDYYDSTFKLIASEQDTQKYIKTYDGKVQEGTVSIVKTPYIEKGTFTSGVTFTENEKGIRGSDGVTYNKISANLNGMELASGETAYVYATFKVEKGSFKGVQDAIALGGKSNLAEISNYSTYYADSNSNAGKIDRDSAPSNIDVRNHNSKNWYEDDADIAPVLNLQITENNRVVSGIAWEDKAEDNTAVGNGVYDEDKESLIGGLTTELVEKVTVKDGDNYIDYDFIWPTSQSLNSLGGMSLEHLTGFDSVIETSRGEVQSDGSITGVGEYSFDGAPTGDYVVRFVYGDNKANLATTRGMTGNATAYNNTGTQTVSGINTSNYAGAYSGKSASVYNGQDYKSTVYQAGFASVNSDGYINNEWHNLNNTDMNDAKISDARDSEARRLEVIANSQTITNANGSVLESANDINASHTELYNNYYMFADTAKLNMNIENLENAAAVRGIQEKEGYYTENGSVMVSEESFEYQVPKIDFGLIERPKNKIILDKEISSIKLTTNDGNVIFDAEYDISYELKDKNLITDLLNGDKLLAEIRRDDGIKYLVANVKLNKETSIGIDVLQAIDKTENKVDETDNYGRQNFRFINVDDSLLQGTTISIDYKLAVINVGDVDYTGKALAEVEGTTSEVKSQIKEMASASEDNSAINGVDSPIGTYLGKAYYTGEHDEADENEKVVTSNVRQLVEYVDNDGVFTENNNNTDNQSWKSTTATELAGNGYNDNRIVDSDITAINEMYDKNGRQFINDTNHNIALSVDSAGDAAEANKDFESKLEPVNSDQTNDYSSEIRITITKSISSQDDTNNLTFDNIAEIVKYENSVGRRDMTVIPGNSNPKGASDVDNERGEFASGLKETDSSATEIVTFTLPTGIETRNVMTSQILIAIIVALGIVAVGIITIKKKVLTK